MLPSILRRAVILVAVCLAVAGMTAFCAGIWQDHNSQEAKLKIGYTAAEDRITNLAVAYVQNMESVRSLCSLEPVTEQEGIQLLEDGELSALIVLPEDVIHEILSGSNTPATLYLPQKRGDTASGGLNAVGSMLFEELASAGIGMLGTAQAEIYACNAILQELSAEYGKAVFEDDFLQSMYHDMNQLNLKAVAGREKLFQKKTLSLTENDTYAVYYGSALFTIYGMLAGLFFGTFCKRSKLQQTMAERRVSVSYAVQLAARCLAGAMLMFIVLLLPFVLFLIPQVRQVLSVTVSIEGILSVLLIILFMTVYFMMIYQIVEKRESALVVIGILAVFQSYLSGCLIPSVLLPKAAVSVGKFLPAAMIKKGFTILFTGDTQSFGGVVVGLGIWGGCLFLGTVLSMYAGEQNKLAAGTKETAVKVHIPSLGMVLVRRLLHRKSMWMSLGLAAVLSAVIVKAEQGSETQITAAVYDESGEYTYLLKTYEGLVRFEWYESDEAVQSAVIRGDAECGYVLPSTLAEDMFFMQANREICLYQDADTVAAPVVNEILFERIFRQVSLKWFTDYVCQNPVIKKLGVDEKHLQTITEDCFNREILMGSTFQFEISWVDTNNRNVANEEKQIIYPTYVVAAVAFILCILQGILQVIVDIREQNFYKRNRLAVSVLTLILSMMLGVLCVILIL